MGRATWGSQLLSYLYIFISVEKARQRDRQRDEKLIMENKVELESILVKVKCSVSLKDITAWFFTLLPISCVCPHVHLPFFPAGQMTVASLMRDSNKGYQGITNYKKGGPKQ